MCAHFKCGAVSNVTLLSRALFRSATTTHRRSNRHDDAFRMHYARPQLPLIRWQLGPLPATCRTKHAKQDNDVDTIAPCGPRKIAKAPHDPARGQSSHHTLECRAVAFIYKMLPHILNHDYRSAIDGDRRVDHSCSTAVLVQHLEVANSSFLTHTQQLYDSFGLPY